MNDYDNGGTLPTGLALHTNTTGSPERVVPYSGLFLAPDIAPVDDDGDDGED